MYDTTHRECIAIVRAVLLLRSYLDGARVTSRTDHDSFKWIPNLSDASGRLAQSRLRLSEFDFGLVHRASVKRHAADAL